MRSLRIPLLLFLSATALLAGCGKVAPNKPYTGEDVYPLRYSDKPSDRDAPYSPKDPALRSLSRAERDQREAKEKAAETQVIVRKRVETAPGQGMTAPAGSVITANPSGMTTTTPSAPTAAAPRYAAPRTSGVSYPDGYKPL